MYTYIHAADEKPKCCILICGLRDLKSEPNTAKTNLYVSTNLPSQMLPSELGLSSSAKKVYVSLCIYIYYIYVYMAKLRLKITKMRPKMAKIKVVCDIDLHSVSNVRLMSEELGE